MQPVRAAPLHRIAFMPIDSLEKIVAKTQETSKLDTSEQMSD